MSDALPYHPSPKKPDIALPAGACDAHCHIFGPAAEFPFAPERNYTPVDAPKQKLFALHRLLGIDAAASEALRARILSGEELAKPGFVRCNLSPMMSEDELDTVLSAIAALPDAALRHRDHYEADAGRAIFGTKAA